jgi:hypothetical protein
MFVELTSMDKNCPVIVNLDHIMEIAPMRDGGCALFGEKGAIIKVEESFTQFKQFALETVTPEDIAKKFPKATKKEAKDDESRFGVSFDDIPTLGKKK